MANHSFIVLDVKLLLPLFTRSMPTVQPVRGITISTGDTSDKYTIYNNDYLGYLNTFYSRLERYLVTLVITSLAVKCCFKLCFLIFFHTCHNHFFLFQH